MKVWGLWHGGCSYSVGDIERDIELFPSLTVARNAMRDRELRGHWVKQKFHYANRPSEMVYTPAVGTDCEMLVWVGEDMPTESSYPDYRLTIGPRGGVRKEVA